MKTPRMLRARKAVILLFFILPLSLCSQESLKVMLNEFIDEWHSDAARADMEAYFYKIDDVGIYIGTDATENWTKQAFFDWSKPYFDKGKAWEFHAVERNIFFSDDLAFAWFDEQLEASYGMLRGSGVLRLKNDQWKIMHYVLSLPVPNEKFNKILEVISEQE